MFAYTSNGMKFTEVPDDHTPEGDEVLFPHRPIGVELALAFPRFLAAVQAEIERLEANQARIVRVALLQLLPYSDNRDRLQVLETQIDELRAQLH